MASRMSCAGGIWRISFGCAGVGGVTKGFRNLQEKVSLELRDHKVIQQGHVYIFIYTLWLFNIAMENGPFIDGFPIKNGDFPWFSMAMLNNQMVYIYIYI